MAIILAILAVIGLIVYGLYEANKIKLHPFFAVVSAVVGIMSTVCFVLYLLIF